MVEPNKKRPKRTKLPKAKDKEQDNDLSSQLKALIESIKLTAKDPVLIDPIPDFTPYLLDSTEIFKAPKTEKLKTIKEYIKMEHKPLEYITPNFDLNSYKTIDDSVVRASERLRQRLEERHQHTRYDTRNRTIEDMILFDDPFRRIPRVIPERTPQFDIPFFDTRDIETALGKYAAPKIKEPKPIILHPELSVDYAKRIAEMPKTVTKEELAQTLALLQVGPLMTATARLGLVLVDKTKQPTRELKDNTQRLIDFYQKTVLDGTDISFLLNQPLRKPQVTIFDPQNDPVSQLNDLLGISGACTHTAPYNLRSRDTLFPAWDRSFLTEIKGKKAKPKKPTQEDLESKFKGTNAAAFKLDSLNGGSVHLEVKGKKATSYVRLYLAVDKTGEVVLFQDVIESNNCGLQTIEDYKREGKEDLLLQSFLSTIIVANKLGIKRVSFGDYEMNNVARELGFGEQKIFDSRNNTNSKIGLPGGFGSNKVYQWRMNSSDSFRTVLAQQYTSHGLENIMQQTYQVMARIQEKPKALRAFKNDFETYFGMVQQILTTAQTYNPTQTTKDCLDELNAFYQAHNIRPKELKSTTENYAVTIPKEQRSRPMNVGVSL